MVKYPIKLIATKNKHGDPPPKKTHFCDCLEGCDPQVANLESKEFMVEERCFILNGVTNLPQISENSNSPILNFHSAQSYSSTEMGADVSWGAREAAGGLFGVREPPVTLTGLLKAVPAFEQAQN